MGLFKYMKKVQYTKGHVVHKEGEQPSKLYFIKEGEVKISRRKHITLEKKSLKSVDKSKSRVLLKCTSNRKIRNSLSSTYDFNLSSTILGKNQYFGDVEFNTTIKCL